MGSKPGGHVHRVETPIVARGPPVVSHVVATRKLRATARLFRATPLAMAAHPEKPIQLVVCSAWLIYRSSTHNRSALLG